MKRWISLFLSLAVVCSACMLSVFADDNDPVQDLGYEDLYVYASIVSSQTSDFATEIPQQGQITDRRISQNYDQPYTKIKSLSFSCPAASYFFIDFDIVSDDSQWNLGGSGSVSANRTFQAYNSSDISISNSAGGAGALLRAEVRMYYVRGAFVHYSIFGVNNSLDYNNIVITYNNPIICTSTLAQGTNYYYNQRITNVTCKTSLNLETITQLMDETLSLIGSVYSEVVSINDTLTDFYNEFHQYWALLVGTYQYDVWHVLTQNRTFSSFTYTDNGDGTVNVSIAKTTFGGMLNSGMVTIIKLLYHQDQIINEAMEQGAGDAYDDLNQSTSFGSLTDFAGAGSAASWSSGSFSEGLNGGFIWFSTTTRDSLDTVPLTRAPSNIINAYDSHIAQYEDILEEGD